MQSAGNNRVAAFVGPAQQSYCLRVARSAPVLLKWRFVDRHHRRFRIVPAQQAASRPSRCIVSARQSADAVPLPQRGNGEQSNVQGSEYSSKYCRTFLSARWKLFIGMSSIYALYVALRATWTFVSPTAASALNLSLHHVGLIASAFPMMYGASRLVTSVVADRTSPSKALCIGLALAGVTNVIMSFISKPALLAGLWGLNGLVQGVGAGASARLLTSWHSKQERGFWWAVWSSSANLGGFIAPLVCGWLSTTVVGFRAGLLIPGVFAVLFALVCAPFLQDSPEAAGLKAPWRQLQDTDGLASSKLSATSTNSNPPVQTEKNRVSSGNEAFWNTIVEGVLKNKRIWALAASYFFVYFVRQGLRSWLHFYLSQARACDAASAAYRVSGMEIGGIVGTFSAGYFSDKLDGRRVAVTIAYLAGLALSLVAAAFAPAGSGVLWDIVTVSLIGLFINGPQCLIGLIGAEVCDPRVVATATGVLGWISYGGAASSGLPLSLLVRRFGWYAFFAAMIASTVCAAVILLPMIRFVGHTRHSAKTGKS